MMKKKIKRAKGTTFQDRKKWWKKHWLNVLYGCFAAGSLLIVILLIYFAFYVV